MAMARTENPAATLPALVSARYRRSQVLIHEIGIERFVARVFECAFQKRHRALHIPGRYAHGDKSPDFTAPEEPDHEGPDPLVQRFIMKILHHPDDLIPVHLWRRERVLKDFSGRILQSEYRRRRGVHDHRRRIGGMIFRQEPSAGDRDLQRIRKVDISVSS